MHDKVWGLWLPVHLLAHLKIQVISLWNLLTFECGQWIHFYETQQGPSCTSLCFGGVKSMRCPEQGSLAWPRASVEGIGLEICSTTKQFCGHQFGKLWVKQSGIYPLQSAFSEAFKCRKTCGSPQGAKGAAFLTLVWPHGPCFPEQFTSHGYAIPRTLFRSGVLCLGSKDDDPNSYPHPHQGVCEL